MRLSGELRNLALSKDGELRSVLLQVARDTEDRELGAVQEDVRDAGVCAMSYFIRRFLDGILVFVVVPALLLLSLRSAVERDVSSAASYFIVLILAVLVIRGVLYPDPSVEIVSLDEEIGKEGGVE